jgi:hypothetical protein
MSPKVALLGNMNNNFFCLMRYLRDYGIDAHLFLWKNELADFTPEEDTWFIEQWQPYIHQTPFYNGNLLALLKLKKKEVQDVFDGYDVFIANGFAPALFYKAGLTLHLMYPYSGGIEFIRYKTPFAGKNFLQKAKTASTYYLYRYLQRIGLKYNTQNIWLFDTYSEEYCKKHKLNYQYVAVPCLYLESLKNIIIPEGLKPFISKMKQSDLVVFSHVAHNYKSVFTAKRNDVLIKGFAAFYHAQKNYFNPILVLLDKGIDVDYSKQLIRELDIEKQVIWIPLMKRKEIMVLLQYADIGGGEFMGFLWGGTGWEFMASALPFMHNSGLNSETFYDTVGLPYPPIFETKNEADVAKCLLEYDKNLGKKRGLQLEEWFNTYNGMALVKKYVDYIIDQVK